jgi:probable rRNA maturation factor
MAPVRLRVNVVTPDTSRSVRGLDGWLARSAPRRARGEVTVALVSDRRMRALNREFRGNDYATDVLSFPAGNPSAPAFAKAEPFLGDIVIAEGVAKRQAKEHGHAISTEIRVLALHGLLHLLGYDHESDRGRMARIEARLRWKGRLTEGLVERSRR